MRHRKQKSILGREANQRKSLMKNLAESLIIHGAIETTAAKARAVRMFVEPLVTKAKSQSISGQRLLRQRLYTDRAINKLMRDIAPRYKDRAGGYTRIIKLGQRERDAGQTARIEFV